MSASLLSNLPSCSTAASIQPKGCRLPTSRRLEVDSSTELHPDFGLIEHRRWCSPGTSPGAWGPPLGNASAAIPGGAWGKRSPSVSAPAAGAAASAQHPPAGDGKTPKESHCHIGVRSQNAFTRGTARVILSFAIRRPLQSCCTSNGCPLVRLKVCYAATSASRCECNFQLKA